MTDMQHAIAIAMTEEHKRYPIDLPALARAIRTELDRQSREYHDFLNEAANAAVLIGPEELCPV